MLGWLTRNWFLLGLATVAGLAFLAPDIGARGGPLRPEVTTKAGVALIFFIQGLVIAPAVLRAGALRWRLHVAVQLFVFGGFPVAVILLDVLGGQLLPPDLRLGFLFLAILPTTISTCVIFTAAAGGNTTGALFNSVLANITGVLLTPLLAALLLSARGEAPALGPMVGEVVLLLLVPLAVGQAARPLVRRVWEPNARLLAVLSSLIILYIVFAAFSNSVATGAFVQTGLLATAGVALAAIGIFAAATAAAALLGNRLGFEMGDRVALLFCGPQKTLAAGAPMAQILFAGHPGLGLILLPVILYHAVQLLGGAALVRRFRRAGAQVG
jgi:solute carrier family 10 (sodium/bile acid cotransporter), member 7